MAAFFFKKTSVAAINITLGVPGRKADKKARVLFFFKSNQHKKKNTRFNGTQRTKRRSFKKVFSSAFYL
jgi:hypothetical protein